MERDTDHLRRSAPTSSAATTAHADAARMTALGPAFGMACTRYGVAFPTVSAPTTVPIASPRRARNQVDAIFIAGGYTPASDSPVRKRRSESGGEIMRLHERRIRRRAAERGDRKESRRRQHVGEVEQRRDRRSTHEAKLHDRRQPRGLAPDNDHRCASCGATALAANHSDMPSSSAVASKPSIRHRSGECPRSCGRRSSCDAEHRATHRVAITNAFSNRSGVDDQHSGREREHFVQVARVDDDACPAPSAAMRSRSCTALVARMSSPRVGFSTTMSRRRVGELSSENELLLIAARQRANRRRVVRAANVVLRDRSSGECAFVRGIDPSSPHARSPKSEILGDGEVEHERIVLPILGDEPDRHRQTKHARSNRQATGEDAKQFALSCPFDAGNANDLA